MLKLAIATILALGMSHPAIAQNPADSAQKEVHQAIETRLQTQEKADAWAADKARLKAEFALLRDEVEQLEPVVTDLREQVARRKAAVKALDSESVEINRISAELLPYLEQLLAELETLVEQDLPFLRAERLRRIETLRKSLKAKEATVGQKFQNVMDAVMAEAMYGNSLAVYSQKIQLDQRSVLVDVLRLGRLSLFCQTPDRQTAGYYNPAGNLWQPLPPRYNEAIQSAIEIASKQRSVELLALPLGKVVAP